MVRPVSSKRKLFNNTKEQFKENKPDQIKSRENLSTYPYQISSSKTRTYNYTKRSFSDISSCDKKEDNSNKSTLIEEGLKKCNIDNVVETFSPSSRIVMPMSERQQIALVMQLSSPTGKADDVLSSTPTTPTPLLGRGLTKRNERGETLLHVAAIKGDSEKVAQLISQGANVNASDYAGWTALHEACNRGFLLIAALLIKGGADVNAKGLDNDTPLHDACVNNHYQIVRLLLTSGAKPDCVNFRNKSPIDICRSPKILFLLEEAKLGKLEPTDISTKISTKLSVRGIEDSLHKLDFLSLNNNCSIVQNFDTVDMSRKTPPKADDKLNLQVSVPSPTISINSSSSISSSSITSITSSSGTLSTGANSRPVSPRVPMRIQHGSRTPDKGQSTSGTRSSLEGEDVYEFRCSKDDFQAKEENLEKMETTSSSKSPTDPQTSIAATQFDSKSDKRSCEIDQQPEDDEESKRKRKKEDKDGNKGNNRASSVKPFSVDKISKISQRSNSSNGKNSTNLSSCSNNAPASLASNTVHSTNLSSPSTTSSVSSANITEQKKNSPTNSASNSPKPISSSNIISKVEKGDSDNEEIAKTDFNPWAPKVPPLKIVLAPCSLSEQETNSQNGKGSNGRHLPYVVNSSSNSTEEQEKESISESTNVCSNNTKETSVSKDEVSVNKDNYKSNNSPPSVTTFAATASVSTPSSTITSISISHHILGENSPSSSSVSSSCPSATTTISSTCSTTNSIDTMQSVTPITSTASFTSLDKGVGGTRITRSQRGGGSSCNSSASNSDDQTPTVKIEPKIEEGAPATEVVHPRKRKIKMKDTEFETLPSSSAPEIPFLPITNCYEMFLKIRKQIERRRKLLFPVQPKPPQGFKDYLMNRCSYVLANNANSQLAVPIISPPSALSQPLKDLFSEQEQERYKLRLQQLIEKEKLVLSVEQEILRVHGRAARALANQVLPFSVCTILKDEEVYNIISPEQEEKDRNARSRYNGRLFLSWLQDVDDKWEKIKEAMVLRHHNEAESLHAVQKMDWEWKLKELCMVEANSRPTIDELHVPMVQVADFDLLPA